MSMGKTIVIAASLSVLGAVLVSLASGTNTPTRLGPMEAHAAPLSPR
jgi:hypothetical protein